MFKRSAGAVVALTVLALVSTGVASATKPIRFGQPQQTFVGTCEAFNVLIELEGTEWLTLFLDSDENVTRVLGTYPEGKATVTRLDGGRSVSFSLAGPLHVDVTPQGEIWRHTGPWLLLSNPATGEPGGVFFARGQATVIMDASGASHWAWHGRSIDVCGVLAG